MKQEAYIYYKKERGFQMALFDFLKKDATKPVANSSVTYGQTALSSFFGGSTAISELEALSIPAVGASMDLISSAVGQLKFELIKKDPVTGDVVRDRTDSRLHLLNNQPNNEMDAYTFKSAMARDYLLYGTSNSVIERNLNTVKALYLLESKKITVQTYSTEVYKKFAKTTLNDFGGTKTFDGYQLLTILRDSKDGLTGIGILKQYEDLLRLALAEQAFSKAVMKNGSAPVGVLQTEKKLSEQAFQNLKASFSNLYAGSENAGKTIVLEEGLNYAPVSFDPQKLQTKELRESLIKAFSQIFNIPEFMISASSNKYGSNEQGNIAFLQQCINPIVSAIENSVNKQLLLENEKMLGYEFKMDTSKLVQLTMKEKMESVSEAFEGNLISFHEARAEIDRPKTEQPDFFRMSLGSVLYRPATDEFIVPNTMDSKAAERVAIEQENEEVGK